MPEALPPVDTSVTLPPSVRAAAAAAEAAHAATYGPAKADVTAAPAAPAQPDPVATATPAQPDPAPTPAAPAAPAQPDPDARAAPDLSQPQDRQGVDPASWEGRYYAMEGRYRQVQGSLGQMQEQMAEMGDELTRATQALQQRREVTPRPNARPAPRITQADVKTYGPELLDLVSRAAAAAVEPVIQTLHEQNQQVTQRVNATAQAAVVNALDQAVPNWKTIRNDPRFRTWCSSRDVYSGMVRGQMLNAAFQAADAPRVIAFYKGFLAEEQATGQVSDPSHPQPGTTPPREAARPLDTLAAPGRAKPATGESVSAADKPIYTRAQISWFYSQAGRTSYVGRDAERKADEASIFAAQREGRVR